MRVCLLDMFRIPFLVSKKKRSKKSTPMCYVMMVYTFSFMIENNNGKGVDFAV